MIALKNLTEIVETCGFENNAITEAQNDVLNDTALCLTELVNYMLNCAFIEVLEFQHSDTADSFTVFVLHHERSIFEGVQLVGSQFVGAFQFTDLKDALACADNIMRATVLHK